MCLKCDSAWVKQTEEHMRGNACTDGAGRFTENRLACRFYTLPRQGLRRSKQRLKSTESG